MDSFALAKESIGEPLQNDSFLISHLDPSLLSNSASLWRSLNNGNVMLNYRVARHIKILPILIRNIFDDTIALLATVPNFRTLETVLPKLIKSLDPSRSFLAINAVDFEGPDSVKKPCRS
jgi:hypothetical protein